MFEVDTELLQRAAEDLDEVYQIYLDREIEIEKKIYKEEFPFLAISNELSALLSAELAAEIDREILKDMLGLSVEDMMMNDRLRQSELMLDQSAMRLDEKTGTLHVDVRVIPKKQTQLIVCNFTLP